MTFDEIVDIAIDNNFEVYIDHAGDLAAVKGRSAFEQELVIRLTERMRDIIGEPTADVETITKLAITHARRVANQMEEIQNVANFNAKFSSETPDVLEVTITYNTERDPFIFEIES